MEDKKCEPDITIEEEMTEDVLMECKTEHEFQDRMDCVHEDLLQHNFVVKGEYRDDFITEHVKEEPMDGVQVGESQLSEQDIKHEFCQNEASSISYANNSKISDDGGSSNDLQNRQFVSHVCTFSTFTEYPVTQHENGHTRGDPLAHQAVCYQCAVNDNNTNGKTDLLATDGKHPYGSYSRNYQVKRKEILGKRITLTHGEKLHICNMCGYQSNWMSALNNHMSKHSGKTPFFCNFCEFRTARKQKLVNHALVHAGETPFICNVCDYRANRKKNLNDHMLKHTGEKPYSCNTCEFRTARKQSLKLHMMIHSGETPFSCKICDYRAKRKVDLKTHMFTHSTEKPYPCNICEFGAVRKQSLAIHMMMHSGEKPYSCNVCEYKTALKESLKKHKWTHSGEKPFSCNLCDYRSYEKYALKNHMMVHTGEKPFSCNLCGYRAKRKGSLKYHMSTHTARKPHACNVCDYRTNAKFLLKNHTCKHPGEHIPTYSCDFCDFTAKGWNLLKGHNWRAHRVDLDWVPCKVNLNSPILNQSGETPWPCYVCDYLASGSITLQRHYLLTHNVNSRYLRNIFRERLPFPSATVNFLRLSEKKLDDVNCQFADPEKAQPDDVVDCASSDVPSETLQDPSSSTDPYPLSDHNYCLMPEL